MYSFLRAGNTFEYFHAVYDFEIFLLRKPGFGVGIFDFANVDDAVGAVDYEVDLNSFPVIFASPGVMLRDNFVDAESLFHLVDMR